MADKPKAPKEQPKKKESSQPPSPTPPGDLIKYKKRIPPIETESTGPRKKSS